MKTKKTVCVSGMERSGTSMIARIVNLLGVYFGGRDDLIMETEYNKKGCWENKTLLKISDEILTRFGGDTHRIPDFAEDWIKDARIADLEKQARKIISTEFSPHNAWGWKDTRCSLIMPFWQNLLPEMEYVICIRNPVDVAQSVLTRQWVSSDIEAYSIWYMYTSSLIRYTAGKRRIFVFYDDFMGENSLEAIKRLAKFLGPAYVRKMNTNSEEIESFITKGLQHHDTSLMETLENTWMPLPIKAYYLSLVLLGKDNVKAKAGIKGDEAINALSLHKDEETELLLSEIAMTKSELKKKTDQLEALLNSGSWRLTAPLRTLVDKVSGPK